MKKIALFFLLIVGLLSLYSCKKEQPKEKLLSLELNIPEEITVYLGEEYVPSGITVYAVYESDKRNVTKKAQFSSIDTMSLGEKQVVVSYEGLEESYAVEVIQKPYEPSFSLVVKQLPNKLLYYVNEPLEIDGLELAFLKDNVEEAIIPISDCTMNLSLNGITKEALNEVGQYRINFMYNYNSVFYFASQYIEVIYNLNSGSNDKLVVDKQRSKLEYYLNEKFEPEKIYLSIKDEVTGNTAIIQSDLCSFMLFYNGIPVEELNETGTYRLLIQYEHIECEVLIEVLFRVIHTQLKLNIDDAKIYFKVGEAFSSSGLVIYYCEDDVVKRVVGRENCKFTFYLNGLEKDQFDEPGTYSVVVDFEGITEGYKIVVLD